MLGLFPLLPDKMKVDRDARTKKPVYTYTTSDEQNPNFNGASRIEYNKFANDHESIKEDNVIADLSVAERQNAHTNHVNFAADAAAWEESRARFLALAVPVLGDEKANRLAAWAETLDKKEDVSATLREIL